MRTGSKCHVLADGQAGIFCFLKIRAVLNHVEAVSVLISLLGAVEDDAQHSYWPKGYQGESQRQMREQQYLTCPQRRG
jgi:hypothetical protein